METAISVILIFMIAGALYALHARDLLSAVIACGIVGYGLVICFLLLKAPDLAIVQIVIETITLIVMVAVVLDSTREETGQDANGKTRLYALAAAGFAAVLMYCFTGAVGELTSSGSQTLRMSASYITGAAEKTGSINLVTGVLFDFRAYDTLGEITILVTAALGIITILRIHGKK